MVCVSLIRNILSNTRGELIKDKHTIPYPERPNFQFLVLARSGLEKGSDYGLLKKCQNEKLQFFRAKKLDRSRSRIPPLLNFGGKRGNGPNTKYQNFKNLSPDLLGRSTLKEGGVGGVGFRKVR